MVSSVPFNRKHTPERITIIMLNGCCVVREISVLFVHFFYYVVLLSFLRICYLHCRLFTFVYLIKNIFFIIFGKDTNVVRIPVKMWLCINLVANRKGSHGLALANYSFQHIYKCALSVLLLVKSIYFFGVVP